MDTVHAYLLARAVELFLQVFHIGYAAAGLAAAFAALRVAPLVEESTRVQSLVRFDAPMSHWVS